MYFLLSSVVYSEAHPRPFFSLHTVAAVCPAPLLYFPSPPKPFRINTCKSVTKQITLTLFRINTYEKHRGEGASPALLTSNVQPLYSALSPLDSALTCIPRFCAKREPVSPLYSALTNTPSSKSFIFRSCKNRGEGGAQR